MPSLRPRRLRDKVIAIVGLGQIGGSILKRLAPHRPVITLLAHDRDRRLAGDCARQALWVSHLEDLAQEADLIILAIPVPGIIQTIDALGRIGARRKPKPLLLDTGTVKSAIAKAAARWRAEFDYIGLHPLAGAEKGGWDAAQAKLFVDRTIVYTPPRPRREHEARELIALLGGRPLAMTADAHDRYVAEAIGLPHLLAFAAQGMGGDNPLRAGSWASLTRVAASDPEMVAGFLRANAAAQRRALRSFERQLARLKTALGARSEKSLVKLLSQRQREGE